MKKRYKVNFTLEGAVEVVASCDEDAQQIVADMERRAMLKDYDEYGFTVTSYEMDKEE